MIKLEVVSYNDSWFTNAHDLISDEPVVDGRGTFTHVGVKMDGLESGRHMNFKHLGEEKFARDHRIQNIVVLRVTDSKVALVNELEFDTAFYTRNNVKDVYSVLFIDESSGQESVVLKDFKLSGDSKKSFRLPEPAKASKIVLKIGEGGLARFKVKGEVVKTFNKGVDLLFFDSDRTDARIFGASDASYGDPSLVLRKWRQGTVMAGWESCRHSSRHRLGIRLPRRSVIKTIELDTYLHCLNPFRYAAVLATSSVANEEELLRKLPKWRVQGEDLDELVEDAHLNQFIEQNETIDRPLSYQLQTSEDSTWKLLLPFSKLERDTLHTFNVKCDEQVASIIVIGLPDGGLHRIGLYGD